MARDRVRTLTQPLAETRSPLPDVTGIDPAAERLLEESLGRRSRTLARRERTGQGLFAAGFLLAAVAFAVLAPADRELPAGLALACVLAYAVLASAEFSTGAGYVVPTQVLFVPMLLLLPTPLVPLLVAAALLLAGCVQVARGLIAPDRLVLAFANAWFALAPAAVLVAAGTQTPRWSALAIYVLALVAQFAADAVVSCLRMWLALAVRPRQLLHELRGAWTVDLLLAPIGLLAAFGAREHPAACLLVVPLAGLFLLASVEREERVLRTLELSRAYRGTALLLRDMVEADDEYTGRHTEDVLALTRLVAEELGVDEEIQRDTELGALLHDVGKIAVPKEILNKAGPLDAEEWTVMRTHTIEGQRMLEQVGGLLARVGVVVRASHERWDGRGYPDGLAGTSIPLAARIVAACDAYNAMTTDRPYRRALPEPVAREELRRVAGTQLDPGVVDALLAVLGRSRDFGLADPEPSERG
jgi:putative nucleotidyltransferase with HDIG domain